MFYALVGQCFRQGEEHARARRRSGFEAIQKERESAMPLTLKPLPFAYSALEPAMSAETLKAHHDKHHAKYVKTVNELIKDTKYADMSLEEIVHAAHDDGDKKLFNNAAQVWNHDLFWNSLTPEYAKPSTALAAAIDASFGSLKQFNDAFVEKGVAHFGSGWLWLVANGRKLELIDLHDADTPLVHGKSAILTCDLWEHAYYLDTQSDRKAFLTGFIKKLANWENAATLFAAATPMREAA
jgi:Fe-Mn family superoxide dismutase